LSSIGGRNLEFSSIPFEIHLQPVADESNVSENRGPIHLKFLLQRGAGDLFSRLARILQQAHHAEDALYSGASAHAACRFLFFQFSDFAHRKKSVAGSDFKNAKNVPLCHR
jgi:hypothetical protein